MRTPALSHPVILIKFTLILKTKNLTKEQEFLQTAIDKMKKKIKIKKLNGETDKFAYLMAEKHKKSLSETVVAARKEEDERL